MADVILGNNAQKAIEPPIGNKTYTTLNELFQIIDPDFYADEEPEVASYYERVLRLLKTMETGSGQQERDVMQRPILGYLTPSNS